MYPQTFENIGLLPEDSLDSVGEEMTELITKLDELKISFGNDIVKYMYGKMEIHDDVMDIYDVEGKIFRTFALYDVAGNPTTMSAVYKREIAPITVIEPVIP